MEDTMVVQEGEFVWKINYYLHCKLNYHNESPNFKFGKYDCYLETEEFTDDATEYRVYLHSYDGRSINYKTFCKLSLIDGLGEEILLTKRTTVKFKYCITLMTISYSDLNSEVYDPLRDDDFTLCLSWHDNEESNQERGTRTASNLNSEEEPRKLLQTLSEDFGRIYENRMDTDFLLRVGEVLIPVHRAMLCARSKVFAAMLRHYTSENQSVVDILGVDASVLSNVLYYVYSGQTRGMSADNIAQMYVVAGKLDLIELRDACLDYLMRNLTVENVCDAALLVSTHGETKLEEEVVQFVKENIKEIEETDKWKELLKSNSSLPVKLLRSALMISKDEFRNLSTK